MTLQSEQHNFCKDDTDLPLHVACKASPEIMRSTTLGLMLFTSWAHQQSIHGHTLPSHDMMHQQQELPLALS